MTPETLHARLASAVLQGAHDDLEASMSLQEAALLAVLELHAPDAESRGACTSCIWDWPCRTVRAIAAVWNVECD